MEDNIKIGDGAPIKPTTLSDEEVDALVSAITEEQQQNDQLSVLANLPSSQGVEEHEPEEGEYKKALVNIDPVTGERSIERYIDEDESSDEDVEIGDIFDKNFEILPEDVTDSVKDSAFIDKDKFDISDESVLELIKIINRYRAGENFSLYSSFPQDVKDLVNDYLQRGGFGG